MLLSRQCIQIVGDGRSTFMEIGRDGIMSDTKGMKGYGIDGP